MPSDISDGDAVSLPGKSRADSSSDNFFDSTGFRKAFSRVFRAFCLGYTPGLYVELYSGLASDFIAIVLKTAVCEQPGFSFALKDEEPRDMKRGLLVPRE